MSFAEFQIRLFAWKRIEERSWEKVRFTSYYAMIGSHINPKKLPKSIVNFMPLSLDKKENILTDTHKLAFLEAVKDYENQLKIK